MSDRFGDRAAIVADLSRFHRRHPGALVMTGALPRVGPLMTGNMLTGPVEGLADVSLTIGRRNDPAGRRPLTTVRPPSNAAPGAVGPREMAGNGRLPGGSVSRPRAAHVRRFRPLRSPDMQHCHIA